MSARTAWAIAAAGLLVVTLAGCGGDDSAAAEQGASPTPSASGAGQSTPKADASGDLVSFDCAPTADGSRWSASGVLVNSAKQSDYRVTVAVAPPGTTRAKAQRLVIPQVATGVETPFTVESVPVTQGEASTCRIQVVRLR